MELNEEQIEVVFKKAHERANEKLPMKERKPYQKTPLQIQQFKNMQKVRTQNIEHVNIASKIISESKPILEQTERSSEETEDKTSEPKPKESIEISTPEPTAIVTPGAPMKKTKKKKEESSEEDDSETEDFLMYQKFKKKKQQAQLKLQAAKKQKKEQKQISESDDEEQALNTPQHSSSSSDTPRAPQRPAFYFA